MFSVYLSFEFIVARCSLAVRTTDTRAFLFIISPSLSLFLRSSLHHGALLSWTVHVISSVHRPVDDVVPHRAPTHEPPLSPPLPPPPPPCPPPPPRRRCRYWRRRRSLSVRRAAVRANNNEDVGDDTSDVRRNIIASLERNHQHGWHRQTTSDLLVGTSRRNGVSIATTAAVAVAVVAAAAATAGQPRTSRRSSRRDASRKIWDQYQDC